MKIAEPLKFIVGLSALCVVWLVTTPVIWALAEDEETNGQRRAMSGH
jgi:hypothetical protein